MPLLNDDYKPVLYLDLDGTVRHGKDELGHFVNKPEDVVIFEGVPELLKAYRPAWCIVGVTNQGGVALGHMTEWTALQINQRTNELCGGVFDSIQMCIHHPDAEYIEDRNCWCRKPKIGMLVAGQAQLHHNHGGRYPPSMALMVGDRPEDKQCAANAEIPFLSAAEWRTGQHRRRLPENKYEKRVAR